MLSNFKRLSALVLLAALAFSLCACTDELSQFRSAIDQKPAQALVITSLDTPLGYLYATYTAEYKGDLTEVAYVKDKLAHIDEETTPDDLIITDNGTATLDREGNTEGEIGALVRSVLLRRIVLDKGLITYTVNDGVLEFTVKAENTSVVLGVDLGYEARVTLITTGGALSRIDIAYDTASGKANLSASYNY